MTSVDVKPLSLPRDAGRLVECWFRVYRDEPHWVPPLIGERKAFFDPARNPYFAVADVQCFLATRAGEPVGTIAATVDHNYQSQEPGTGFFGFFEFVDDVEVARSLLDAAGAWLRERGMSRVIGPFNFNTNHEFGLLVDGFDSDPCVANPYNSAYFVPIYEQLGLSKVMDWYAYWIDPWGGDSERLQRISDRFLSRHPEIRFRPLDLSRYEADVKVLLDIYTDAWEQNWGHVHIEDEEFYHLAKSFKRLIDPTLCFMATVDGEPAALSISFPDLNQAVKGMRGRVLPFGWLRFLLARRRVDGLRVFMLGVKKQYQHLPLGAPLYTRTWKRCRELGIKNVEASLILETNHRMRGALERMGFEIYKTYRNFELDL